MVTQRSHCSLLQILCAGEVWLGLAELHKVTSNGSWGLLVKLTDWNDKIYWAYYDRFQVSQTQPNCMLVEYHGSLMRGGGLE